MKYYVLTLELRYIWAEEAHVTIYYLFTCSSISVWQLRKKWPTFQWYRCIDFEQYYRSCPHIISFEKMTEILLWFVKYYFEGGNSCIVWIACTIYIRCYVCYLGNWTTVFYTLSMLQNRWNSRHIIQKSTDDFSLLLDLLEVKS